MSSRHRLALVVTLVLAVLAAAAAVVRLAMIDGETRAACYARCRPHPAHLVWAGDRYVCECDTTREVVDP